MSSKSQAEIHSVLGLQSSSTLGTGAAKTHQDRLDREEDKEIRRAFDGTALGRGNKRRRRQPKHEVAYDATDESDGIESVVGAMSVDEEEGKSRTNPVVIVDSGFSTAPVDSGPKITLIGEVGSALQRNADGSTVAPRISKKKPKQQKVNHYTYAHLGNFDH